MRASVCDGVFREANCGDDLVRHHNESKDLNLFNLIFVKVLIELM